MFNIPNINPRTPGFKGQTGGAFSAGTAGAFPAGTRVALKRDACHRGITRHGVPAGTSLSAARGRVTNAQPIASIKGMVEVQWDGAKEPSTLYTNILRIAYD